MIIKKALYGLKSSGAAFRAHLPNMLYNISFISTNGAEYYEYAMCYIDDILSVSLDAISVLRSLQGQLKLKDKKIEPPDVYLGAQLGPWRLKGITVGSCCQRSTSSWQFKT